MRLLTVLILLSCLAPGAAFAREAKEQRARRDVAARALLLALDDRDAQGIESAVKTLAENLEPEGVPVFAPLKARLEALASALLKAPATVESARMRAAISEATDVFGVDTSPPLTPEPGLARDVYKTQCRACHGDTGAGDGELAVKVKGGVPSLVSGPAATKSPFAFYQKIAAGRPGTPMPGYDKKLDPTTLWALAFLAAGFDAKTPKSVDVAPLLRRGLSLERLARSDDAELAAWAGDPALVPFLRAKAPYALSIPRAAPR